MKYEIYTNYEGMKPTDLEVTFETLSEVIAWCEAFDETATDEESYIVYESGKVIMMD
jgi:hypothetical protein